MFSFHIPSSKNQERKNVEYNPINTPASMDSVLYSGNVEKYSMGRGTGIRARNWKTRFMKVTRQALQIYDSANSSNPKFEVPTSAISLCFAAPTKEEHPEATNPNLMIMIRLFDNGVFNLLIKCKDAEDKAHWLAALRSGLTELVKGFQMVEAEG